MTVSGGFHIFSLLVPSIFHYSGLCRMKQIWASENASLSSPRLQNIFTFLRHLRLYIPQLKYEQKLNGGFCSSTTKGKTYCHCPFVKGQSGILSFKKTDFQVPSALKVSNKDLCFLQAMECKEIFPKRPTPIQPNLGIWSCAIHGLNV